MTSPDPNQSIQYDPPINPEDEVHSETELSQDPLASLLAEERENDEEQGLSDEEPGLLDEVQYLADEEQLFIDEERLYTDEFIRANENASRTLFLGVLAGALLVTSAFAWFVLSQPGEQPREESPSPVSVPSSPPENIPDLQLDSVPANPTDIVPPSSPQPDPTLVFPATPVTPEPSSPGTTQQPETDPPPASLNNESVPPPPPINP